MKQTYLVGFSFKHVTVFCRTEDNSLSVHFQGWDKGHKHNSHNHTIDSHKLEEVRSVSESRVAKEYEVE